MSAQNKHRLVFVWAMLVIAYFFWEANNYRGIYRFLAERQISWFGWYVPMLTFAIPAFVLIFPVALIMYLAAKRRGTTSPDAAAPALSVENVRLRIAKILMLVGFVLLIASAALAVWSKIGPPKEIGEAQTLALGRNAPSFPAEGPTHLGGATSVGRVALFAQSWPSTMKQIGFAPIFGQGDNPHLVRFFVQLRPDEMGRLPPAVDIGNRSGILARREMPGTILALYRGAGYSISDSYYTLYTSDAPIRMRYRILAVQFAISGLLALALAMWQRRYARRRRRIEQSVAQPV